MQRMILINLFTFNFKVTYSKHAHDINKFADVMMRRRKFPLPVGGIESVSFADIFLKDVVDIVKNGKRLVVISFGKLGQISFLGNYSLWTVSQNQNSNFL